MVVEGWRLWISRGMLQGGAVLKQEQLADGSHACLTEADRAKVSSQTAGLFESLHAYRPGIASAARHAEARHLPFIGPSFCLGNSATFADPISRGR